MKQTLVVRITDEAAYNAAYPTSWPITGAEVTALSQGDRLEVCDVMYDRIEEYCDNRCDNPDECEGCPLNAAKEKWGE